jgi:hypothetical protein
VKALGKFLLTSVKAYVVGAFTFFLSSALVSMLTQFGNWTLSLPMWGFVLVSIVLGYIVIGLYEKLPEPKEK